MSKPYTSSAVRLNEFVCSTSSTGRTFFVAIPREHELALHAMEYQRAVVLDDTKAKLVVGLKQGDSRYTMFRYNHFIIAAYSKSIMRRGAQWQLDSWQYSAKQDLFRLIFVPYKEVQDGYTQQD